MNTSVDGELNMSFGSERGTPTVFPSVGADIVYNRKYSLKKSDTPNSNQSYM